MLNQFITSLSETTVRNVKCIEQNPKLLGQNLYIESYTQLRQCFDKNIMDQSQQCDTYTGYIELSKLNHM